MMDCYYLMNSYIATILFALIANVKYDEVKNGNNVLHKFIEKRIENSNNSYSNKQKMKRDLDFVKETLSQEIEQYWKYRP